MRKIIFAIMLLVFVRNVNAQSTKPINSSDLILECMKVSGELPNKQMALWLPYEFWQIVANQMKISPESATSIVNRMKPYFLFAVVDYSITDGKINFRSDDEVRKNLKLTDSSGNAYLPINEDDLSPDAREVVNTLSPIMSQLLGQFGEGMRLFLFKAKQKNGEPVINISSSTKFSISWDSHNITWKLPFASALPKKYCPVDHEEMKGNWKYCPDHGVLLTN